jgi:hypothetical protein
MPFYKQFRPDAYFLDDGYELRRKFVKIVDQNKTLYTKGYIFFHMLAA